MLNDGRRPERVVEEFVGPAPGDLDRLPGELRQSDGLDGLDVPGLPAEPAADEWHDDVDVRGRDAERLDDLVLEPERGLGRRPDRGPVALDARQGRMRFHRGVGHIGVQIGFVEKGGREGLALAEVAPLRHDVALRRDGAQVIVDILVVELCLGQVVFGLDEVQGRRRRVGKLMKDGDEIAVPKDLDPFDLFRRRRVQGLQLRAVGGRPEDLRIQHSRQADISREQGLSR